jgi:molecular chaperone Hsp33
MKHNLFIGLAFNQQCRVVIANTQEIVQKITASHQTTPTASAVLGRTLTAGLLLASSLKGEEKYTIRLSGDGPIQEVVVDATSKGTVRGYVSHPSVHLPPKANGKLDVSGAIGTKGLLTIVKHTENDLNFTGQTPFISGEIAEDFTHYLVTSEQIPSAMGLGVLVNPDESIQEAGGFLIQALPGVRETTLANLEHHLATVSSMTHLLKQTHDLLSLAKIITGDEALKVLEYRDVSFACTCSLKRTEETLMLLGKDELLSMIQDQHGADVHCNFCNAHYAFDEKDLTRLIRELTLPSA